MTEEINGAEWKRVGGLTVPWPLPGQSPLEALPKTTVKISLEIQGGGLANGEAVTVELEPLELRHPGQLKFDVLERVPDIYDEWYPDDGVSFPPQRMIRLVLDPTEVSSDAERIYTITHPEGSIVQ